jgi:hypothetical protein
MKAAVATHDRLHSGKEFHLFCSILNMMAIAAVPTDEVRDGVQVCRVMDPEEMVFRAEAITVCALAAADRRAWVVETDDIDLIYRGINDAAG